MHLFIDTHLFDIILILIKDGKIIKERIIREKKENSKYIMPNIKELLDNEKIDSIIVVNGPGSFTGVRLGVTIAKTLAYTLNIPIRTITSLECLAVSLDIEEKTVAFSDKNGYYVGTFDKNNNLIGDYMYLSNDEFIEFSKNHHVELNVTEDYIKIINYSLEKEIINPHQVNPIYIKKLSVEK